MQICPTCRTRYADSLRFCLADGTALTPFDEQATLRVSARETHHERPVKRKLAVGALAFGALVLVGLIAVVGAVVVYFVWSAQTRPEASRSSSNTNTTQQSQTWTAPSDDLAKEVVQLNEQIGYALVHDDLTALDRMLANDYRYVSDTGLTLTKRDIITLYQTGNIHYEYLTDIDSKVTVDNPTKAEVTGRARSKGQYRRQPFTDSYFYRNTYEKRTAGWQLVSGLVWHR
jgi:hypothetical protein